MSDLHGQDLVAALEDKDRIAAGKLGQEGAKNIYFENLRDQIKESIPPTPDFTTIPYEAYIWEGTLYDINVNILRSSINTPDIIKFDGAETINRIKVEIEELGTGAEALTINFRINGLWLLASDFPIPSAGYYNFTELINNTVVEGDEFEFIVIQSTNTSGIRDIGGMGLKIFTS